ncbi:MAG TPA: long-chain fatty acid--CoA ligase [Gammaproteobacteria bacterium]|nr:long-chain fatty acid--CoA ligase [Gammaproteobacteria bacterium]
MKQTIDTISAETAGTLPGLFRERLRRSPGAPAYRHFDDSSGQWRDTTWQQMAAQVGRWQRALQGEQLQPGDRVAVMLANCREWVLFDQAALGLGLVVVPLYVNDSPENLAYVLEDSGARLLLIQGGRQWCQFVQVAERLRHLQRVLTIEAIGAEEEEPRLRWVEEWLPPQGEGFELISAESKPDELATVVYTSGTSGRPKGVMLSHRNILSDAEAGLKMISIYTDDLFLSFLPLSHTLERTIGYYLPIMSGSCVAFARSIQQLNSDFRSVRPTVFVSVPRIFERIRARIEEQLRGKSPFARWLFRMAQESGWRRFERSQGRAGWHPSLLLWPLLDRLVARKVRENLGGRVRFTVCGGAPLAPDIARMFISLDILVLQGYGLTEASPVISVNSLEDNVPSSIGRALPGIEVRLGEKDELLARGPNVMLGYWNNPDASREAIDREGWLHTGDKASIDEQGHISLTGRLKDILVLANGEKIPPAEMEMAIIADPLFEQVMVIGEQRPFLSVLAVLNREQLEMLVQERKMRTIQDELLRDREVESVVLQRISRRTAIFPGYAQIRRVHMTLTPWTVEEGLITPTLKLRRNQILRHHAAEVERIYAGH